MNDVDEYDYYLPRELIAQHPPEKRDSSRLLLIDRKLSAFTDSTFSRLPDFLCAGDLLVANRSRVIPARLYGHLETGGQVELLLIRRWQDDGVVGNSSVPANVARGSSPPEATVMRGSSPPDAIVARGSSPPEGTLGEPITPELTSPSIEAQTWEVMAKPAKKLKRGTTINLPNNVIGRVEDIGPEGRRWVTFQGVDDFPTWLQSAGKLPIPPYIKAYPDDPSRYQTIYAAEEGSVAAPTAGLHFTSELLIQLAHRHVDVQFVTLHVGPGTFKTVEAETLDEIRLEPEWGTIDRPTASAITRAKAEGRRVIAVGTTTTRLLEGLYLRSGAIQPWSGDIDLLIHPPFAFKVIDAIITNFHLPRSTLLMLVSAFAGKSLTRKAYEHAVAERYRFYSFGDAMFIQ